MAPIMQELEKRQYYNSGYCSGYGYYSNGYNCYYSPWNAYGRWILLAVIVVVAFLVFLLFSCCTARRRRRMGRQPFPLTGWAARPPQGQPYGYGQQQQQQGYNQGGYNAPPAYGGQQYGVAQPQPVYQNSRNAGAGEYAPPSVPPPGKN